MEDWMVERGFGRWKESQGLKGEVATGGLLCFPLWPPFAANFVEDNKLPRQLMWEGRLGLLVLSSHHTTLKDWNILEKRSIFFCLQS